PFSTYAPPIYLSSRTRLISNLHGYLKVASKSKTEEELLDTCIDILNLKYIDILFYLTVKIQIINLSSNSIIKSKILQEVNDQNVIQEVLKDEHKGKEITDIVIKDNKLIISIDNVEYNPSSFGNGFQSILTM